MTTEELDAGAGHVKAWSALSKETNPGKPLQFPEDNSVGVDDDTYYIHERSFIIRLDLTYRIPLTMALFDLPHWASKMGLYHHFQLVGHHWLHTLLLLPYQLINNNK